MNQEQKLRILIKHTSEYFKEMAQKASDGYEAADAKVLKEYYRGLFEAHDLDSEYLKKILETEDKLVKV